MLVQYLIKIIYHLSTPVEVCAGAIFYNGDGESLGWLDAARRRTGEGISNRYHQHVSCDDDVFFLIKIISK